MRYQKLSNTGLFASELCLGTMTFGGEGEMWGKIGQLRQAKTEQLVGSALDAGINFIDTANVYSEGHSEEITGQALKNLKIPRENVVVTTEVFGETDTAGVNSRGSSRYHIMGSVKESLRRLQLDHIDLCQLHGFSPATPIKKTLSALDTLVQQGHVHHIDVSNWTTWQIARASGIAECLELSRFASLQAYHTIAGRNLKRELVPMLQNEGLGLMIWSPLTGGLLSGKYRRDGEAKASGRCLAFDFPPMDKTRAFDCINVIWVIAGAKRVLVAQIALMWLLYQPAVTSVIIGAKRTEQLQDSIATTAIRLNDDELCQLDAVSALPREYPGWMLERQGEHRRHQLDAQ